MSEDSAASFTVSIVIPAYNEQAVIAETVRSIAAAMDSTQLPYEIRVVDDQSSDNTWTELQNLQSDMPHLRPMKNDGPGGYGMAVRAGLAAFEGDAVIVAMADGSDAPEDIAAYASALAAGADAAFGSRFRGDAKVEGYPPVKLLLNRMGNALIALLIDRRYGDYTNGFKGYRRWVVEAMAPLVSAEFNLTVEMSIKAVHAGAHFEIIPNHWRNNDETVSNFHILKLGGRYFATIFYCLALHWVKNRGARPRH